MRKVISNTTPLIGLSNIGCLEILQKLYGEILIPQAVFEEIKSEPAKTLVKNCGFIHICQIKDERSRRVFSSRLHAGEVAVMLLAEEVQPDILIMDDNASKKTSKFMGFKVTGTLGVLLRAKREGHIKAIKPLLERLSDDGFFISDSIKEYVLEEANEKQGSL